MRLRRSQPEIDAALLFSPDEWKVNYILAIKRPTQQAPTLNIGIRLIADLGGFLGNIVTS